MQQRPRTSPRIESLAAGGPTEEGERAEPVPEKKAKSGLRLVSRDARPEDTVIAVGGARIGGEGFVVTAGPCAVESREQIFQCARLVKECGGQPLRGGRSSPRPPPLPLQGLGLRGPQRVSAAGRPLRFAARV